MKRYLFLAVVVALLAPSRVTMANDPSPGPEQVSITKQLGIINPPVMELTITPTPALPYVVVIEQEPIHDVTILKPSPMVQKALPNSGSTPVVSADRSVGWSIFIKKPLNYSAILPFNYIEGRATEYRC